MVSQVPVAFSRNLLGWLEMETVLLPTIHSAEPQVSAASTIAVALRVSYCLESTEHCSLSSRPSVLENLRLTQKTASIAWPAVRMLFLRELFE